MTQSYTNFKRAIKEAKELFDCYETLNNSEGFSPPGALKKASLILALTAWETYVEDVATELFHQQIKALKGSALGVFAEKQITERLKFFHNPNSSKTKRLFEEFFDFDVTEQWSWSNTTPKDAREQLNKWINKRGDAVHRNTVELNQPDIVNKNELSKCLRFFEELARVTDEALVNI